MFSKQLRVTTKEFKSILKNSTRIHSPTLMIQFLPADTYKFAVVVPKKFFKLAVDRNKIKRVLYGCLKLQYTNQTLHTGVYIVIVKKLATQKTLQEIKIELQELLKKIKS